MSYNQWTRRLSFNDCEDALGRTRQRRKVANNTYLRREDANTFAIVLHLTPVVLIHRDGTYTLNSGGWQTVTTKDRLNIFSPASVWQKDYRWYIARQWGSYEDRFKNCCSFFDGIKVDSDGIPVV